MRGLRVAKAYALRQRGEIDFNVVDGLGRHFDRPATGVVGGRFSAKTRARDAESDAGNTNTLVLHLALDD
jgi:hypothetical protein